MSDVSKAVPVEGQTAAVPASAGQTSDVGGFDYSYEFPDGKEKVQAKSKEDLDKYFKEHYLRTQDYTRKTQTLAEFRKQVEKEREDMKKSREDLERKSRDFTDYDWMIKNRPDVYKQLQRLVSSPPSPDVAYERAQTYADEQTSTLKKELDEVRQQMEEDRLQRQRIELMGRLRGEYPDYPDDDSVNATLEELGSGDLEKVLRFIYFANKGKSNPLEVEKRMAEAHKKKEGVRLMPSSGSAPDGKKTHRNLDEAADEYLRGKSGG